MIRLFLPTDRAPQPALAHAQGGGAADRSIARRIGGHAHLYGMVTSPLENGRRLRIMPGAFRESLSRLGVYLLWQHQEAQPLANTFSRTLEIIDTDRSLQFKATLPATSFGDHVFELVRTLVVREMSVGLRAAWRDVSTERLPNGQTATVVRRASLHEISIVTWGAQPQTVVSSLSARSSCSRAEMAQMAARRMAELHGVYKPKPDPRFTMPTLREIHEQQKARERRSAPNGREALLVVSPSCGLFG